MKPNPKKKLALLVSGVERTAIEMPADPNDGASVMRLLSRFEINQGGVTQEEAATLLASMALTLSNIAAAHLVARVDKMEADIGVGFAVEGGMLNVDFAMSVLDPALRQQDRWERNLLHDVDTQSTWHKLNPTPSEAEKQLRTLERTLLPLPQARKVFKVAQEQHIEALRTSETQKRTESSRTTNASAQQHQAQHSTDFQNKKSAYQAVFNEKVRRISKDRIGLHLLANRNTTIYREILNFPLCITEVSGIRDLDGRVSRAHLGRALVSVRIDSVEMLEKIGLSLLQSSGRRNVVCGGESRSVRIDHLFQMGSGVINDVLSIGGERSRILNRILWLVESTTGGDLPEEPESAVDGNRISIDFPSAFQDELRKRMHFTNRDVHELPALDGKLKEWRAFLRERERHFPGIALVAGNLPQALCYGLESLGNMESELDGDEVLAYARWLVLRMLNRQAVVSNAHVSSELEQLAGKVAYKLAEHGPMTVRGIVRKFPKLPTRKCREALCLLEERSIAAMEHDVWGILGDSSAAQPFVERVGLSR